MKKLVIILTLTLLFFSMNAGIVGAEHVKEADKKISLNTGLNLSIPFKTAKLTYNLQEGIHNRLTGLTGLEVDHFYIWVELDGQDVLAVDPARVMY
ncbi:hypothetical protein [Ornithinibacillus californiensis]|uniref:hypothetical protein n=1 Tax=Ornithinibacillus californiensis TaxID=161536 RepID=UPI00064DBD2D|nr:hypothetical protein [Ornithinibacillus californiensis]